MSPPILVQAATPVSASVRCFPSQDGLIGHTKAKAMVKFNNSSGNLKGHMSSLNINHINIDMGMVPGMRMMPMMMRPPQMM